MIKLLIIVFVGLFNISSNCSWNHFSDQSNNVTINGKSYFCDGSLYISNEEVRCNGQKITETATDNKDNAITKSGKTETKEIPIQNIQQVSISEIGNLIIHQCEDPKNCVEKLKITADSRILPYLEHKIYRNKINLGIKTNVSLPQKTHINYHLTVRDIIKIQSSGSTNIESFGISTKKLSIDASDSSAIKIKNIKADNLIVNTSNSPSITIDGEVNHQEIEINGPGAYNANALKSKTADINLSGAAKISLNVINTIKGYMAGTSLAIYNKKHNPNINVQTSGSSKIRKS